MKAVTPGQVARPEAIAGIPDYTYVSAAVNAQQGAPRRYSGGRGYPPRFRGAHIQARPRPGPQGAAYSTPGRQVICPIASASRSGCAVARLKNRGDLRRIGGTNKVLHPMLPRPLSRAHASLLELREGRQLVHDAALEAGAAGERRVPGPVRDVGRTTPRRLQQVPLRSGGERRRTLRRLH